MLAPDQTDELTALRLWLLKQIFGGDAYLALAVRRRPRDRLRLHNLGNVAARVGAAT